MNNNFDNSRSSFADNSDIGGFGNNGLNFSNQGILQNTYDFGSAVTENNSNSAMSIEIRKVYLGKTRPQSNQDRRTYDITLNGSSERAIENSLDRYREQAFNTENMGKLLSGDGSFISLSGIPDAPVDIENGWDAQRFRFTMVVDVYRNARFQRTEFVSGYTNHDGVTNMGMISSVTVDPNMVFTINHVTEARARNMDANGRPLPMIAQSNSVVRNNGFKGVGSNRADDLFLTRPSDVLRAVDKIEVYNGMQRAGAIGDTVGTHYQDLDSMLTTVPMMSADTNLLLPTFASRTLTGLLQNSLNKFDPMNMDGSGNGSLASLRVGDNPFTNSGFIHVMNRALGNGVSTTATFTFMDLIRMDSTIDDRTDVFGVAYETGSISIPDGRSVDYLGEVGWTPVHATSIVQTTLALMSLSGVATLAYSATNMNTGNIEVTLQACDGLDVDGMLYQRLEVLKGRLIFECLSAVAKDGAMFEVEVFADAFNDAFIQLTWEGVRRNYVIPSFASSSLAPVVTKDLGRLVGMAEAINDVVTTCKEMISPSSGNNSQFDISVQGSGEKRYGGLAGDF